MPHPPSAGLRDGFCTSESASSSVVCGGLSKASLECPVYVMVGCGLQQHPEVLDLAILGKGEAARNLMRPNLEVPLVQAVADALRLARSSALLRGPCPSWRSNLVRGFVHEAGQEQHLADWFQEGAPIGVPRAVPQSGIFPVTPPKASAIDAVTSLYTWTRGTSTTSASARIRRE